MPESLKVAISALPQVSKLYQTYIANFSALSDFYSVDYRSLASLSAHAERVRSAPYPRHKVARILREQNERWGASTAVLHNLEALAQSESLAIVTGQQVGVFGGPLFTIYKALTCLKLAQNLSAQLGVRVVPVFWLAADDDDIAEINRLVVTTRDNNLATFVCELDSAQRKPAFKVHLTESVETCHRALAESLADSEFKQEILAALAQAYAPGQSLVDAFARWMAFLFRDFGLVLLNPTDPALRRLGAPVFQREIDGRSPSTEAALQASARLAQSGFSVQVPQRSGRSNLFYVDEYRHGLEWRDGGFVTTDGTLRSSPAELLRRLQDEPQCFSTNVITRPILQDTLLPTVAYIGGPAEIAYFAQLRGVYERFGVAMPAVYPRKSLTLLEKKISHVLEKYALQLGDFWGNPDELLAQIARREAPEGLFDPVAAARDELGNRLSVLKERAIQLDPTLAAFIDKEHGKILHQLEALEKKLLQATKRQNETLQQQLLKAAHALYPMQHLQERELSIVPFLCKYGKPLLMQLYEAMEVEDFQHQVIAL
ncbi:bacillithiol biosynthesis cysteine-adding enzyme BshC [candidate division KSB1 bacterium]|nr:bacillithiol biosynthesis cysteine-adding enzyme BshC [candidate division KSB1 bacterium]